MSTEERVTRKTTEALFSEKDIVFRKRYRGPQIGVLRIVCFCLLKNVCFWPSLTNRRDSLGLVVKKYAISMNFPFLLRLKYLITDKMNLNVSDKIHTFFIIAAPFLYLKPIRRCCGPSQPENLTELSTFLCLFQL